MFKLLDRQMFRSYVKSYLVCLVSLVGLFIIVDLFTNLDDFISNKQSFWPIMQYIGKYYSYKSAQIFDLMSEAIVLLAAMFTVAWMQRNNELLPLLSAGVSTRRVVRPVLVAACAMMGLCVINQELILPRIDSFLVEYKNEGDKEVAAKGAYDSNNIHLTGGGAIKNQLLISGVVCTIPASFGRDNFTKLEAHEARYIPEVEGDPRSGGWILTGTLPATIDNWPRPDILEQIVPGKYFLKTDLDFETMTRSKNWYRFVTTYQLVQELGRPGSSKQGIVAVLFHMRLTRPILGMLLVFMGLSVILRDQNRNIFISAGLCLVLCGVFFTTGFACKYLGDNEILSPTFAAWLPVLMFGPLSFVMFDAVHT